MKENYKGINIGLFIASVLILLLICLLLSYCVEDFENFGKFKQFASFFAIFKLPSKDKNETPNIQKLTTPIYNSDLQPMPENILNKK